MTELNLFIRTRTYPNPNLSGTRFALTKIKRIQTYPDSNLSKSGFIRTCIIRTRLYKTFFLFKPVLTRTLICQNPVPSEHKFIPTKLSGTQSNKICCETNYLSFFLCKTLYRYPDPARFTFRKNPIYRQQKKYIIIMINILALIY